MKKGMHVVKNKVFLFKTSDIFEYKAMKAVAAGRTP